MEQVGGHVSGRLACRNCSVLPLLSMISHASTPSSPSHAGRNASPWGIKPGGLRTLSVMSNVQQADSTPSGAHHDAPAAKESAWLFPTSHVGQPEGEDVEHQNESPSAGAPVEGRESGGDRDKQNGTSGNMGRASQENIQYLGGPFQVVLDPRRGANDLPCRKRHASAVHCGRPSQPLELGYKRSRCVDCFHQPHPCDIGLLVFHGPGGNFCLLDRGDLQSRY
ncbi:hypothetical protein C8T65DRAFT_146537 [Cerioporus squamosus]|nr:hypothetical protein C8T65DRAFT_146537 [Cerioporus squamosus]